MNRITDTGYRTSQSEFDMSSTNDDGAGRFPVVNLLERPGEQHDAIGALDVNNANIAILLGLDSMRNVHSVAHQNYTLSHAPSNDTMSNFGTSLVQQFLQRQQRQHILEQNLLAQRLEQLRNLQSMQLTHEIPALNQHFGTNPYGFAPFIQQAVNILPQNFQLTNNLSPQDNLLDMILSNNVDRSYPNRVGSASLGPMNPQNDGLSFLQLQVPEIGNSNFNFAAEPYNAVVDVPVVGNTTDKNEVSNPIDQGKNEPQAPIRALSAYNFFFRYERERILNAKEDGDNDPDLDISQKHQEMMLKAHWNRDRTIKRRHRKSHGKISFSELSKKISQRWNELPEHQKNFFNEVASKDWERYHREIEQQKLKQKA